MSTGAIDEARLEEFMGRMVDHMTGATACFSIWLGDELGLYGALSGGSARSADELPGRLAVIRDWCGSGSTVRLRPGWSSTTPRRIGIRWGRRRRWRWRMTRRLCSWRGR